jgi:acyl-CoA synthetase (AMP-forming)/AMP-acid ligase II
MPDEAPITVAQVLWRSADRFADRPCVSDLDAPTVTSLTYRQMVDRAASVAGALLEPGLSPGDRVALLMPNSVAYVDAWLGASAAGLVVVPLNVRLVREDYLHMLADSQSRILITTGEFLARIPELGELPGVLVVRADAVDGMPSELDRMAERATPVTRPVARAESDVASLMYTSGTTGTPKAVMLSHRSWASVADTAIDVLGMGSDEVMLHVAPLTHGAGFLLLPTLALGGLNLLCASFDAERTLRLFRELQVTGLFVVPSMIRMMLDAGGDRWTAPDTLRRLYYAGSPIDPETMPSGGGWCSPSPRWSRRCSSPRCDRTITGGRCGTAPTCSGRPVACWTGWSCGSWPRTARSWTPTSPVRSSRAPRRRCWATGVGPRRARPP